MVRVTWVAYCLWTKCLHFVKHLTFCEDSLLDIFTYFSRDIAKEDRRLFVT